MDTWPGIFHDEGAVGFSLESPVGGTAWPGAQGLFSGPFVSRVTQRIGVLASLLALSSRPYLWALGLELPGTLPGEGRFAGVHLGPFQAWAWGGG